MDAPQELSRIGDQQQLQLAILISGDALGELPPDTLNELRAELLKTAAAFLGATGIRATSCLDLATPADKQFESREPASEIDVSDAALRGFQRGLRIARKRSGLTQGEIARRSGTTQSHVSEAENSVTKDLRLATFIRYANAAGYGLRIFLVEAPDP